MTWRAMVIGDIHLRTNENTDDTIACLEFAALVARERQVDAVIFGGDIYEASSKPAERAAFGSILHQLAGIPVYGIAGNHDAPQDVAVFNLAPGNLWLETPAIVEAGPVDLLMVPWAQRAFLAASGYAGEAGEQAGSAALAAMLRAMVATRDRPGHPLVVLGHLQVCGALSSSAQPMVGRAIEAALGDLQDLEAAFVALGHVHRPQELAPGVEYIGSLTCHDFGEEAEQKRVGILTVEDDGTASVEWVSVPCRKWYTVEASIDDQGEPEEYVCQGGEVLRGVFSCDLYNANLRYRYTCDESQQHLFDHARIQSEWGGDKCHTLKIVAQVTRADRIRSADVAAAKTVEEKLAAWGRATETPITPAMITKLHELEGETSHVNG